MVKRDDLKALLVLTKYNLISSFRNFSTIFFGFLFPFIFILVFGLVGNGNGKVDIGVLNSSDKTNFVYDVLKQVEPVNLIEDKSDDELKDQLEKGQIPGIITIKIDGKLPDGKPKYSIDLELTTASQTSPTAANVIKSIVEGINNPPNPQEPQIVGLNVNTIEGRKYENIDFILPGQLSFALLTTGVFGIAITFVTLKRTLVLKRIFATPASKWVVLVARTLSSLVIALLQASVIILVGHFLFNFTLANGITTFLSMLGLSMFGLVVFLGLGLLVSSLGNSEEAISPIANLLTLPQFLLSGAFFPITAFPDFLQTVAKIMPMTYLNNAMRAVAFEGSSITGVLPELGALAIWGIIIYILVVRMFKWE